MAPMPVLSPPGPALPVLPGAAAARRVRAGPLLALTVVVLAGHAWLAQALAPGRLLPGVSTAVLHPAALQVRSLLPPAGRAPAPAHPAPVPPVDTAVAPGRSGPDRPADRPAGVRRDTEAPAAVASVAPVASVEPDPPLPAPDSATLGDAAGEAAAGPDGEPPPLYPTRLPPPARLHYTLQRNGRSADAWLHWSPGADGYRLELQAAGSGGRPVLAQASTGGLDAHGLAPERFVDRRAGGAQRAANFRRDIGRIGYSGPAHAHPAWPGAQDRLSWLVQLVAILAAQPSPPSDITLFVADATGQAGLWHLQRQSDAAGAGAPDGPAQQHWQRAAPRPEALQVDVWFAAPGAAPALGGWPLRLRFSVPRSGDVLELTLADPP